MDEKDFIKKSLELYSRFNKRHIYYNTDQFYNKLVTADPFYINQETYKSIIKKGEDIWDWLHEQHNYLKEVFKPRSRHWLYKIFQGSTDKHSLKFMKDIVSQPIKETKILRFDVSRFPFCAHEAQLRWGIIGHLFFVDKIFNEFIPIDKNEKIIDNKLDKDIQKIVDKNCPDENQTCLFLTTKKYRSGTHEFVDLLRNINMIFVKDCNEQNLKIQHNRLIYKPTNQEVTLIFRRQLTLETLVKTNLGREIVKLYLDNKIKFEPDLNLINDGKLGMALLFDKRSRSFFSDKSRKLFLPTSFFDQSMRSFNSVFNTDYKSLEDFLERTSAKQRDFVFKYGGTDLSMCFGSSQVYRLDRSAKLSKRIIKKAQSLTKLDEEWIIQEMDRTRYKVRYLKGDYNKPSSCQMATSENCPARIMLIYSKVDRKPDISNATINFVNDHWKARLKTSDTLKGKGAILTSIRVKTGPKTKKKSKQKKK